MEQKQKIFCDEHKDQESQFIHIEKEDSGVGSQLFQFICKKCIVRSQGKYKCIVDLEEILNDTDSESKVIGNLPLINNQDLVFQIEDILKGEDNTAQLLQTIEQQYSEVKVKINQKIDKYYKHLVNLVNLPTQKYISEVYKKASDISRLREFISKNNDSAIEREKINELIREQLQNEKRNSNLLEIAIKQHNEREDCDILFTTLSKKLEILFEKIDGRYVSTLNLFDLLEQQSQEKIQKVVFVNYANSQLQSLHQRIYFAWQSFEEINKGISIQLDPINVMFAKGYFMTYGNKELNQNKEYYKWWVNCVEHYSNSGNRYLNLNYNKRACNYLNYNLGNKYSISFETGNFSNQGCIIDIGKIGLGIAQDLKKRINLINQEFGSKEKECIK